MTRVLHLLDTWGPGGAETVFVTLVRELASPPWESTAALRGRGWVSEQLQASGCTPLMVQGGSGVDPGYLLRLHDVIRRKRIDLVHAHLLTTGVYGGVAASWAGIPSLVTFHGSPDLDAHPLHYPILRATHHRIVFVSESLRDRAVREGRFRNEGTEVVHNGIDVTRFRPGPEPDLREELGVGRDEILVGSVGNVRPLKDYPTLLRTAAAAEQRAPGRFRFVVVGDTEVPAFDDLLRERHSLGLDERVHFLGFRDDVDRLMRAFDVFLLTSSSEGFSLVCVQAMASELPVVATRSGGPEEIIRDGTEGLLAPPGDPAALAGHLLALAAEPLRRREMGRQGFRTARSRFSIPAMIARYEHLYRMALGHPSYPAAG